jgi:hypothetical protein
MRMSRAVGLVAVAASALLLAACTAAPVNVRSTDRSVAAATIDILGAHVRYSAASPYVYDYPKGSIGADVHLTAGGKKIVVTTMVSRTKPKDDFVNCRDPEGALDGCTVQTVNGHRLITWWQLNEPEEDPGILVFTSIRGNEYVDVIFSGPTIRTNPLKGGIPIPASKLQDVATSVDIGLKTTKAYADAGAKLSDWR